MNLILQCFIIVLIQFFLLSSINIQDGFSLATCTEIKTIENKLTFDNLEMLAITIEAEDHEKGIMTYLEDKYKARVKEKDKISEFFYKEISKAEELKDIACKTKKHKKSCWENVAKKYEQISDEALKLVIDYENFDAKADIYEVITDSYVQSLYAWIYAKDKDSVLRTIDKMLNSARESLKPEPVEETTEALEITEIVFRKIFKDKDTAQKIAYLSAKIYEGYEILFDNENIESVFKKKRQRLYNLSGDLKNQAIQEKKTKKYDLTEAYNLIDNLNLNKTMRFIKTYLLNKTNFKTIVSELKNISNEKENEKKKNILKPEKKPKEKDIKKTINLLKEKIVLLKNKIQPEISKEKTIGETDLENFINAKNIFINKDKKDISFINILRDSLKFIEKEKRQEYRKKLDNMEIFLKENFLEFIDVEILEFVNQKWNWQDKLIIDIAVKKFINNIDGVLNKNFSFEKIIDEFCNIEKNFAKNLLKERYMKTIEVLSLDKGQTNEQKEENKIIEKEVNKKVEKNIYEELLKEDDDLYLSEKDKEITKPIDVIKKVKEKSISPFNKKWNKFLKTYRANKIYIRIIWSVVYASFAIGFIVFGVITHFTFMPVWLAIICYSLAVIAGIFLIYNFIRFIFEIIYILDKNMLLDKENLKRIIKNVLGITKKHTNKKEKEINNNINEIHAMIKELEKTKDLKILENLQIKLKKLSFEVKQWTDEYSYEIGKEYINKIMDLYKLTIDSYISGRGYDKNDNPSQCLSDMLENLYNFASDNFNLQADILKKYLASAKFLNEVFNNKEETIKLLNNIEDKYNSKIYFIDSKIDSYKSFAQNDELAKAGLEKTIKQKEEIELLLGKIIEESKKLKIRLETKQEKDKEKTQSLSVLDEESNKREIKIMELLKNIVSKLKEKKLKVDDDIIIDNENLNKHIEEIVILGNNAIELKDFNSGFLSYLKAGYFFYKQKDILEKLSDKKANKKNKDIQILLENSINRLNYLLSLSKDTIKKNIDKDNNQRTKENWQIRYKIYLNGAKEFKKFNFNEESADFYLKAIESVLHTKEQINTIVRVLGELFDIAKEKKTFKILNCAKEAYNKVRVHDKYNTAELHELRDREIEEILPKHVPAEPAKKFVKAWTKFATSLKQRNKTITIKKIEKLKVVKKEKYIEKRLHEAFFGKKGFTVKKRSDFVNTLKTLGNTIDLKEKDYILAELKTFFTKTAPNIIAKDINNRKKISIIINDFIEEMDMVVGDGKFCSSEILEKMQDMVDLFDDLEKSA